VGGIFPAVLTCLLSAGAARAANLPLTLNQIISPGVPGAGAGQIDIVTDIDTYTFAGTNGQAIYFQEITNSPAFHGYLQWEIRRPTGNSIISSGYFDARDNGRLLLPENGTYLIESKWLILSSLVVCFVVLKCWAYWC
jgi:hypothetical protein